MIYVNKENGYRKTHDNRNSGFCATIKHNKLSRKKYHFSILKGSNFCSVI